MTLGRLCFRGEIFAGYYTDKPGNLCDILIFSPEYLLTNML